MNSSRSVRKTSVLSQNPLLQLRAILTKRAAGKNPEALDHQHRLEFSPTCSPCSHLPSQVHSHLHCPEPPCVPGNDHVPMDPASPTSSQPRSTAGKPRASLQAQLGFLVLEVKPAPLLHLEEGATALPLPVLSL